MERDRSVPGSRGRNGVKAVPSFTSQMAFPTVMTAHNDASSPKIWRRGEKVWPRRSPRCSGSERRRGSYTQHDDVHQVVHARAFEDGLPAVLHQFGVGASEDHQAEAPLRVPQRAASQQDLVVVQAVRLSTHDQVPFELVQTVVGGLTLDLTCHRITLSTSGVKVAYRP